MIRRKKKTEKKVLVLAGIVLLVIAGVGLAQILGNNSSKDAVNPTTTPVPKETNQPKEYTIIRQPNETGGFVKLALIADEKGFFEEEGIKIEWTGKPAGGGPGALASIAGGSNDVGSAAVSAIINSISRGVKVKAIAPEYELYEETCSKWYVLENSSIKTAKDLVGKKISVNTLKAAQEYSIREYLSQNGVPFDVQLVVVDTGKLGNPFLPEAMLRKGEVDAIAASEVPEWKLLQTGGVRVLFTDYQVWGRASGKPAYVVSQEFMKKNPDAVRRYVTALAKAADYTNAHPEEALKIDIKRNYPTTDPETAKHINPRYYPEHALISEEQVKLWIDRMVKYGDIKEGQIKPSDIYTNEFNPYFKK